MLQAQNIHMRAAPRSPQQRMLSIAIVAAFHAAVIAVLITAFAPRLVPEVGPLFFHFVPPKPTDDHPKAPIDPTLVKPAGPVVPPPVWPTDNSNAHNTIFNPPPTGGDDQGSTQALPTRSPVALFSTHTTPPYPPLETRMGVEGNVLLRLAIDADGQVTDAEIVRSSGHDDLDQTAARWVKAHWRYLPALQSGQPVAATTTALVTFRLSAH